MAHDEELAQRFRDALEEAEGVIDPDEKRMMGGACFFVRGNMLGGADITKEGERRFMFRVGKLLEPRALERPGAIPVVLGKRRMGGMVFVDAEKCSDAELKEWVSLAFLFVGELPAKP